MAAKGNNMTTLITLFIGIRHCSVTWHDVCFNAEIHFLSLYTGLFIENDQLWCTIKY